MSLQDHPTHNELERLYCDESRGNIGPAKLVSIEQHLGSCRLCRLRLDSIRRFVDQLATGKIRRHDKSRPMKADHVSVDDMDRYHSGQVHGLELARLEEHLLWCQHCLDNMEATERFGEMVSGRRVATNFGVKLEA